MGGEHTDPPHLTFLADRTLEQIAPSQLLIPLTKPELRWWSRGGHAEQFSAAAQVLGPMPVAQKAVMANPLEAVGQDMQQEAPQKLVGRQRHQLLPVLVFVILVAEGDLPVFQLLKAVVGDGHTVCVPAEIIQHSFRTAERRLGVDYPFRPSKRSQVAGEGLRLGEVLELAVKLELASRVGLFQVTQIEPAKPAR